MFVKEQQDEDRSYLITHKIKKGVYMFDFWGFFKNSKLEKINYLGQSGYGRKANYIFMS